jgi:hypothetical protein
MEAKADSKADSKNEGGMVAESLEALSCETCSMVPERVEMALVDLSLTFDPNIAIVAPTAVALSLNVLSPGATSVAGVNQVSNLTQVLASLPGMSGI